MDDSHRPSLLCPHCGKQALCEVCLVDTSWTMRYLYYVPYSETDLQNNELTCSECNKITRLSEIYPPVENHDFDLGVLE